MILQGKLKDISRDYKTKKPIISFLLHTEPNGIDALDEKDLKINITRASSQRSLNSNAYFHKLCGELAKKNKWSLAHQKNELIAEFGQYETLDDDVIVYKTNCPPHKACEFETPHMAYIKRGEDGAYWYKLMRGSHTYSVSEMHELIEGTVLRCRDAGVPVATPDERAHMEMLWQKELERKGKQYE